MKKFLWGVLIFTFITVLLMTGCVNKKIPVTEPPETIDPIIGNGIVTLNWEEVEGADNYELNVTLESASGEEVRFVNLGNNIVDSPPEILNISTEGTYTWKVRGRNAVGNGPWNEGQPFYGEPKDSEELLLDLSSHEIYECGEILATVTALNPNIDKVKLMARRDREEEYVFETDYQNINNDDQAVFRLNQSILGENGKWLISVQAYGNTVKTKGEEVVIKPVIVSPVLKLKIENQSVKNGETVCVDELPVDGEYFVDIDFDDIAVTNYIDELLLVFEFKGHNDDFDQDYLAYHYQNPFDEAIWEETRLSDIELFFATECTKYATLTIIGTTCTGESSFSTHTNLDFILDGSKPEVIVKIVQPAPFGSEKRNEGLISRPAIPLETQLTKTATVQFSASDTKSLCEATLSFFVEKQNRYGEQMTGWEKIEIPWGQKAFTIGTGERKIDGEATYSGILGKNASTSINATAILYLSELDGATITSSMEVINCCDVCCQNKIENSFQRTPVSDEDEIFFDNVFYKVEMVDVDFTRENEDFMITDMNNPATFTFQIADAYFIPVLENLAFFFGEMPPEPPNQGVIEGRDSRDNEPILGDIPNFISSVFVQGETTLTVAECTGYPTKTTILGTISILTDDATEAEATFTIMALDENFNVGIATQTIKVDTFAPSLTAVQGVNRNNGPRNDAIQFAFRAEDEKQGIEPLGATVTVYDQAIDQNPRYLPVYYSKEHIRRLFEEGNIWTIDPLSKSVAMNEDGSIKLEILSKDGYGNEDVSILGGAIINGTEGR